MTRVACRGSGKGTDRSTNVHDLHRQVDSALSGGAGVSAGCPSALLAHEASMTSRYCSISIW